MLLTKGLSHTSENMLSKNIPGVTRGFKYFQGAKKYSRVLRQFLQIVVFVDGVVNAQVDQLLQRLIDEDDADQRGESFLGEASDVTHQRAGICSHQQEAEEGRPQADARPEGEVGEAVLPERNSDTPKQTGVRPV